MPTIVREIPMDFIVCSVVVPAIAVLILNSEIFVIAERGPRNQSLRMQHNRDLTRIEDYANGTRRMALISERSCGDVEVWTARVVRIENVLNRALLHHGLELNASQLRAHTGCIEGHRVYGWEIPAPHGPAVLDAIAERCTGLNQLNRTGYYIATDD